VVDGFSLTRERVIGSTSAAPRHASASVIGGRAPRGIVAIPTTTEESV